MDTFTIIQESQPTKKVDISLRQLIDIDETGGITATNTRAVGKIENNQILTSFAEVIDPNGTLGKVKSFRFKYLSSLFTSGTGITVATDKDGLTTITNTGVTKIIAGSNITISPITGVGNVTVNSTGGGGATPTGYYGAWQDNVTQTAAASNTGYAMILRTIDLENQVRVVTNGTNLTRITFDNTGIYNLQFSSQFQNSHNSDEDVTIWLRLNGVDVPASSGFVSIPAKHGSVNGHTVTSWNYLLSVVAGQYYELMWSTTSHTNVTMQYYAAGSPPPSAASVILTVTQQSGIMAGTGITAINSLTGAAQTLVTNGSGTDFNIASVGTTLTFNLPTASAANRGALSSTDWSTFNGKENAANKQNSLAIDGTGVKFPTVDAVNSLSMIDRGKRMVSFFADFLGGTVAEGMSSLQSGGTFIYPSIIPQRTTQQGVIGFQTVAAATNYIMLVSTSGSVQLWFGNGVWNYETSINLLSLSNAVDRYRLIIGFGSANNTTAEVNGVFFTYDEGATLNGTAATPNWQCVTVNNSVRTLTTTTVAVTAATWNKLRIEINADATSVGFYINGTLVATHTTNIPTISAGRYLLAKQGIFKAVGISNRIMYVDYIGYENIQTTPR